MSDARHVLAPIGKRFSAKFVDGLLGFVSGYSVMLLMGEILGGESLVPIFSLWVVAWLYALVADGMFDGQSIGKKLFGLFVVDTRSGIPCSYTQSVIRNVTSLLGVIDYVFIISKDRRRLGDRLAGTSVMLRIAD